jgi:hypothetical protein
VCDGLGGGGGAVCYKSSMQENGVSRADKRVYTLLLDVILNVVRVDGVVAVVMQASDGVVMMDVFDGCRGCGCRGIVIVTVGLHLVVMVLGLVYQWR